MIKAKEAKVMAIEAKEREKATFNALIANICENEISEQIGKKAEQGHTTVIVECNPEHQKAIASYLREVGCYRVATIGGNQLNIQW
jgi:hypothetical protein